MIGRRIRLAFLLVLLLNSLSSAHAQKHPNVALGFQPDGLYQFNDLDSINLFSGNVIVRIPIGPKYPVGGQLSYQLMLTHNSNVWDYEDIEFGGSGCTTCRRALPNVRSNAGRGWRLSLGRLISYDDPHAEYYKTGPTWWIYESSAGDEHVFASPVSNTQVKLHFLSSWFHGIHGRGFVWIAFGGRVGDEAVRRVSERREAHVRTGWQHVPVATYEDRRPVRHSLTITYTDVAGRETRWTIDDSTGRQHTVDHIHV